MLSWCKEEVEIDDTEHCMIMLKIFKLFCFHVFYATSDFLQSIDLSSS